MENLRPRNVQQPALNITILYVSIVLALYQLLPEENFLAAVKSTFSIYNIQIHFEFNFYRTPSLRIVSEAVC